MSAGQQLGVDMANNFMLMTLFSLVADMAEDPDGFRTDVKKALLDLTDDYNLAGVAPETAKEAALLQSRSSPAFFKMRSL
ncbi:MAG: hypothetical protein JWR80_2978 [Bradyrhizobium sp.]|nr:hypothetical protein [Bradyrhizobium sp.]